MNEPIYERELRCAFDSVHEEFSKHISSARSILSEESLDEYYDGIEFFSKIGQGDSISIAFSNVMHWVGSYFGKNSIQKITDFSYKTITRSPNKELLVDFLFSLIEVINYVKEDELEEFLKLIEYQLKKTTYSVHGIHVTHSSPSFRAFLSKLGLILSHLDYEGIYEWINYGLRYYKSHPEQQEAFFSLLTSDSRAVFQRQRKGVLFVDIERQINLFQLELWGTEFMYAPYSPDFEKLEHFHPYLEDEIIRLPDIYPETKKIDGTNRYFALVAHLMAHNQFTTAIFADNLSPHQRLFVEVFEDARVEYLCSQKYPGFKSIWKELIPEIGEDDCVQETQSCIRHRAAMLSRALIDENHKYKNLEIIKFVDKFNALMSAGKSTTEDSLSLGLDFLANTRNVSDSLPDVFFTDTEISYRDDNRIMWIFIEKDDEGDDIFPNKFKNKEDKEEQKREAVIPPHYYDEWDYKYESYKPDWTSVYERLYSNSDSIFIDQLLEKNGDIVKQLKRVLDLLKPQNKKRLRFQEDGSELDLDIALRSVIELKNRSQPDSRINNDFEHDSRSVSVLLLLDLSESLNDIVEATNQTILELSQEAVSLLAWSVEQLGDNFAIAGFNSNTRDQVMYYHIKGYSEHWDDSVKARLANLKAEYSTRMGAAIRHGAHYLDLQKSDKKLMLILTDGEPFDIDIKDPNMLIKDTHKAIQECRKKGMYPYCISLDNKADDYISDVFGSNYSVIDRIESLPKELPQLFLSLTK